MAKNKEIHGEKETIAVAKDLAAKLLEHQQDFPAILCLSGPLGAGKSVFARALIRALHNDPNLNVPSPTFTLIQTYDTDNFPINHFDLYRLEDPEEIYELGWEDAISEGITIVEWPERLAGMIPARRLDITIKPSDNNPTARIMTIQQQE
jgi:tRNA threonylcarbamoyl adenosine modification protein YjeE